MVREPDAPHRSPSIWRRLVFGVLFTTFVLGGIYSGYFFFATVRDLVAHAQLVGPAAAHTETSPAEPGEQTASPRGRVNILLLGIDKRPGEYGPSRTDTMILVTIDPQTNTTGMLSIPRDLWVSIPGYAEGRINTAHFLGEKDDYPGGGPALAKKTVQYLLGIPVHYYVRVNFEGFEHIVDTIGGITIDVKEAIHDTAFPDNRYGYITVDIPAGVQTMDGKTALQYARARHNSSDFSRARRQQEVVRATANKAAQLDIPLTKIPEILRTLGESVQTDLSLSEMYSLARLARDLDLSNIRSIVIDEKMTTSQLTPDGADVLIPDRTKIRELVNEVFNPMSPEANPHLTEKEAIALEGARIEVLNGTLIPGLAQQTAAYLQQLGYEIIAVSNADRGDYASSLIMDLSGKPNTVSLLRKRLSIPSANVREPSGPASSSNADIRLILGKDLAALPSN